MPTSPARSQGGLVPGTLPQILAQGKLQLPLPLPRALPQGQQHRQHSLCRQTRETSQCRQNLRQGPDRLTSDGPCSQKEGGICSILDTAGWWQVEGWVSRSVVLGRPCWGARCAGVTGA